MASMCCLIVSFLHYLTCWTPQVSLFNGEHFINAFFKFISFNHSNYFHLKFGKTWRKFLVALVTGLQWIGRFQCPSSLIWYEDLSACVVTKPFFSFVKLQSCKLIPVLEWKISFRYNAGWCLYNIFFLYILWTDWMFFKAVILKSYCVALRVGGWYTNCVA